MVLGVVLGGGKGNRVLPLTNNRAKPAVPLGGTNRLIDVPVSNLINSDIRKIFIITQFESRSLHTHVHDAYDHRVGQGEFVRCLGSRQGNSTGGWSRGTAEAVYQNLDYINKDKSKLVDIVSADQVYVMDFTQINAYHTKKGADLTISVIPVKRSAAKGLGVLEVDKNGQIIGFEEKSENPKTMPGNKDYCLASMGIYTFSKEALSEALVRDAKKDYTTEEADIKTNPDKFSKYDFGSNVIPDMLKYAKVFAYDFSTNSVPGQQEWERGFWEDAGGSIEDYYKLSMQLRSSKPPINLHNDEWEIFTYIETSKPVQTKGKGYFLESIVANGSIIRGTVKGSVLGYNTLVNDGAEVTDSVLMGGDIGEPMVIGNGAVIKNSIIDKRVIVPDKETVGVDEEKDRERGFYSYSTTAVRPVIPADYKFSKK
jgi:glucose-1-phosphate adenylyltransferase